MFLVVLLTFSKSFRAQKQLFKMTSIITFKIFFCEVNYCSVLVSMYTGAYSTYWLALHRDFWEGSHEMLYSIVPTDQRYMPAVSTWTSTTTHIQRGWPSIKRGDQRSLVIKSIPHSSIIITDSVKHWKLMTAESASFRECIHSSNS